MHVCMRLKFAETVNFLIFLTKYAIIIDNAVGVVRSHGSMTI